MLKPTVLFTEEQIQARIRELAAEISRDFAGKEVILIGLLNGAFIFLADLSRAIKDLGLVTECFVDFMGTASYGNGRTPGDVRIELDVRDSLRGKHVILVDDIADSLNTLLSIARFIKKAKRPKTLRICVLLEKPDMHQVPLKLDYVGFSQRDLGFVYGCGMDLDKGSLRCLRFIARAPSSASA